MTTTQPGDEPSNSRARHELSVLDVYGALSVSPFAIIAIDPGNAQVSFVNRAAAAFLGRPVADVLGLPYADLLTPACADLATASLDALARGAISVCRGTREFLGRDGPRSASEWMRAFTVGSRAVAIAWIVPSELRSSAVPALSFLWGDLLIGGITDESWGIDRIAGDVTSLLGHEPGALHRRGLLGLLHPTDALNLTASQREGTGATSVGVVRALHADGTWQNVRIGVVNLSDHTPSALAFGMTDAV